MVLLSRVRSGKCSAQCLALRKPAKAVPGSPSLSPLAEEELERTSWLETRSRPGWWPGWSPKGRLGAQSLNPSTNEPPYILPLHFTHSNLEFCSNIFFLTDALSRKNLTVICNQVQSGSSLFSQKHPAALHIQGPASPGPTPRERSQGGLRPWNKHAGKVHSRPEFFPPGGPSALPSTKDTRLSTAQGRAPNPTACEKMEQ